MAKEFESSPHGIRNQINNAQKGSVTSPNIDPKTGWDRRGMALSALDKLDLRHMDAFADYLLCIAR